MKATNFWYDSICRMAQRHPATHFCFIVFSFLSIHSLVRFYHLNTFGIIFFFLFEFRMCLFFCLSLSLSCSHLRQSVWCVLNVNVSAQNKSETHASKKMNKFVYISRSLSLSLCLLFLLFQSTSFGARVCGPFWRGVSGVSMWTNNTYQNRQRQWVPFGILTTKCWSHALHRHSRNIHSLTSSSRYAPSSATLNYYLYFLFPLFFVGWKTNHHKCEPRVNCVRWIYASSNLLFMCLCRVDNVCVCLCENNSDAINIL